MKTHIIVLIGFLTGSSAMAGGMIGGGEVRCKSLITCDAKGIDPAQVSSPFVWVVKEVDYHGNFIPDATLRVVTLDKNLGPIRFYVTDTTELVQGPDLKWPLNIWRYEIGSQENENIGQFVWDEPTNGGLLKSSSSNEVEELQLSNCIFELQ